MPGRTNAGTGTWSLCCLRRRVRPRIRCDICAAGSGQGLDDGQSASVTNAGTGGHTAVPACNHRDDRGPNPGKQETHVALVVGVDTPGDPSEEEPSALIDDIGEHRDDRDHGAEQDCNKATPTSLLLRRNQSGTPGIQDKGQAAEDRDQSAGDADVAAGHDLDLHVAEAFVVPAAIEVIIRPDECVDNIEYVEEA